MKISTFDTTLRDGTQGEAVSFSVEDKLLIAQKLDELGIDYIEGGWPGSNPKDKEFFAARRRAEAQARAADGLRLHALRPNPVEEDRNVRALVEAGTPVVSIFGKTLGPARVARAGHLARREPEAHLRDREVPEGSRQGSDLRRRALLRRLCGQSGLRAADAGSRADGRRRRAVPVRHQRRHHHRPPGGGRRRSAQALRRRDRHPHAQRFRRGGGQRHRRGGSRAPRTCRAA